MTDKKTKTEYITLGLPLITLIIFFGILTIINAEATLLTVTVENIFQAFFWTLMVDLILVAIILVIVAVGAIVYAVLSD